MKTKMTLALAALMTGTAFAAFQAPLPEFKNEKQLAEWRAEKASESARQGYATEETAFYTGKPYLASSGGYAFKYRSYNPELARWTSEDPSGFPDGANPNSYAPRPTSELDWAGLLAIVANSGVNGTAINSGVTMDGQWLKAVTTKGNQIDVFRMSLVVDQPPHPPIPGVMHDFSSNCHGYVFLPGYWIDDGQVSTILSDEWTLTTNQSKAKIAVYGNQDHSAKVVSHLSNGDVQNVMGKNGYTGVVTTDVGGTGFGGSPKFYE